MTATRPDPDDLRDADTVTLSTVDGLYVATDEETGVSSQGQTETSAYENLAAALASYADGQADDDGGWL